MGRTTQARLCECHSTIPCVCELIPTRSAHNPCHPTCAQLWLGAFASSHFSQNALAVSSQPSSTAASAEERRAPMPRDYTEFGFIDGAKRTHAGWRYSRSHAGYGRGIPASPSRYRERNAYPKPLAGELRPLAPSPKTRISVQRRCGFVSRTD